MRNKLIELLSYFGDGYNVENRRVYETKIVDIADYLLANGVVVIDTSVVSPKNRPLITQCLGIPLDEIIELISAVKMGHCDPVGEQGEDGLLHIKQEVAREIFEEIENRAFGFGACFVEMTRTTFDEIKKKYTESEDKE